MSANADFVALHNLTPRQVYETQAGAAIGYSLYIRLWTVAILHRRLILSRPVELEPQAPSSGKPLEQQGCSAQQRAGR